MSDQARASIRTIRVQNPFSGETIGEYPEAGATDLRAIIRHARNVQPAWAALPLRQRRAHVKRMREWLVANADRVADVISRCTGKTRLEAFAFDVAPSIFGNAWYCRHAARHLHAQRIPSGTLLMANKYSRLFRKPRGVIGIISPWNYPLGIPMHEIAPALLAGNTVVFKTAPETIPVGELIVEMCRAAKLPDGVFAHVIVDGPVCGDVMLENGGVDKLFFTGSVRVGKWLAAKAAENLKPVSLELGGKDAMIVLDDASIERAAHGALWGGLQNAGQSCGGVERVYVHRAIYDGFLGALKRRVESLRVHGPERTDSDLGVLTTERQVATVKQQLDEALAHGAVIHARGRCALGSTQAMAPTVLINVSHDMTIMREETFGPVIGVMPFDTEDDAIRLANDSAYGLTASVWSRNPKRAERIARQLRAGAVTINDHLMSHGMAETPWGGPGDSGGSRGHGAFIFEEVTEAQVVVHDQLGNTPRAYWWYPYDETTLEGLRGAVTLAHGKGLAKRLRGAWHYLQGAFRIFRKH